mmetsp:Transcript_84532/g.235806  ORF Transcript_84532/g.235806 Transcript_84532/m.235806 type:complete len:238 (-) Transcript_84532:571-1284(-)
MPANGCRPVRSDGKPEAVNHVVHAVHAILFCFVGRRQRHHGLGRISVPTVWPKQLGNLVELCLQFCRRLVCPWSTRMRESEGFGDVGEALRHYFFLLFPGFLFQARPIQGRRHLGLDVRTPNQVGDTVQLLDQYVGVALVRQRRRNVSKVFYLMVSRGFHLFDASEVDGCGGLVGREQKQLAVLPQFVLQLHRRTASRHPVASQTEAFSDASESSRNDLCLFMLVNGRAGSRNCRTI